MGVWFIALKEVSHLAGINGKTVLKRALKKWKGVFRIHLA